MGLESVTYISDLNANNPTPTDLKSQGDDHLRNIKSALLATFPGVTGAVTATHTELNYVDGVTSAIQTQLDAITTLANGKIYVGNGSNVATEVTPSGDVTMTNAGVTAIGATKVTKAMLNSDVFATNTEATTGTATDILLPPSVFASTGRNSLGTSGYQRLPGGLIIQWGRTSLQSGTASSDTAAITFPIAFGTAVGGISAVWEYSSGTSMPVVAVQTVTTSGFTAISKPQDAGSVTYGGYVRWIALGY